MAFKKSFLLAALLAGIGTVPATLAGGPDQVMPPVVLPTYFNGFYAGLGGGVSDANADLSATSTISNSSDYIVDDALSFSLLHQTNVTASETFGMGTVDVGYSRVFGRRFYLGLEFIGTYNSDDIVASTSTTANRSDRVFLAQLDLNARLTHSIRVHFNDFEPNLVLEPGLLINDRAVLYGIVGMTWNKVKASVNSAFSATASVSNAITGDLIEAVSSSSSISSTQTKDKTYFTVGAGLKGMITERLALRMDYRYINYGTISQNRSRTFTFNRHRRALNADGAIDAIDSFERHDDPSAIHRHYSQFQIFKHVVSLGLDYYFTS